MPVDKAPTRPSDEDKQRAEALEKIDQNLKRFTNSTPFKNFEQLLTPFFFGIFCIIGAVIVDTTKPLKSVLGYQITSISTSDVQLFLYATGFILFAIGAINHKRKQKQLAAFPDENLFLSYSMALTCMLKDGRSCKIHHLVQIRKSAHSNEFQRWINDQVGSHVAAYVSQFSSQPSGSDIRQDFDIFIRPILTTMKRENDVRIIFYDPTSAPRSDEDMPIGEPFDINRPE